ncbi:MAG TPA: pyridoxamine 5'-phosphate oxidase [Thermoanaerobaculia bacterium]|nr:pyridoxamine 5'-phosphate oxidase [Thermoanaerobaculia bacterium]
MKVADVRREYALAGLSEENLAADPIDQLRLWLDQAREAQPEDFTAMVLATADREGRPAARVVLLKGLDERGLVFYTHYESRKGQELLENPKAALVFYWSALERQVRIEGTVEKISREESAAYFDTRPRGSRLGAWASPQSRPLAGRDELEERVAAAAERFADGDIPLPDDWGGYLVRPESIEFWQGRPSRLHDRLRYERHPEGGWRIERLAP